MSDRTALLSSAISFLRDPSTASSALAQRIAFLESKGLNQQEIEQALSAANGGPLMPYNNGGGGRGQLGGGMGGFRGREFERDWRDYFIMSVVGGGVGWLAVKLAQVSSHLGYQGSRGKGRERRLKSREWGNQCYSSKLSRKEVNVHRRLLGVCRSATQPGTRGDVLTLDILRNSC